jgi:diadenosine tetraphosphate (Ap4A) HIT family hydrolase
MPKRVCSKCDLLKTGSFFFRNDSVVAYFSRLDFRGHTVVLLKEHKEKVSDMTPKQSHDFIDAMIKIGKAIEKTIKPDILNYQFNMNWNRHVHAHIYPRFKEDDLNFGGPIKIPGRNANFRKKALTEKEKRKIAALARK